MAAWTDADDQPDTVTHLRPMRGLLWGLLLAVPAWGLVIVAAFLIGYAVGSGWR